MIGLWQTDGRTQNCYVNIALLCRCAIKMLSLFCYTMTALPSVRMKTKLGETKATKIALNVVRGLMIVETPVSSWMEPMIIPSIPLLLQGFSSVDSHISQRYTVNWPRLDHALTSKWPNHRLLYRLAIIKDSMHGNTTLECPSVQWFNVSRRSTQLSSLTYEHLYARRTASEAHSTIHTLSRNRHL